MTSNETLRKQIKDSGFFQWQVAAAIGVTEMTLIRWLRMPVTKEQERRINAALEQLKGGAVNG